MRAIFAGLGLLALAACGQERQTISYVEGALNAEDLVPVPGSRWIVASGLDAPGVPGRLTLIEREAKSARVLFSADAPVIGAIDGGDPACPGPPSKGQFGAHGIALRQTGPGQGTLYAINHTGREAVELFALDWTGAEPVAQWTGCVPLPRGVLSNGVTPLPEGRIAVTWMNAPEYFARPAGRDNAAEWIPKFIKGETTGYAATWSPGEGWKKIAGSEGSVPNGIEAASDGSAVYLALWGEGEVRRIGLADGSVQRAKLDFWPDNLRRGDDGQIWLAGAVGMRAAYFACAAKPDCENDFRIARIDPATMNVVTVPHPETRPRFGDATTAVRIGGEVWIGSNPTTRVAVLKGGD